MDTLLSLSDNEIEAINPDHELVLFDHIKKCYSPATDLTVSYLLGSAVVSTSFDWVGLYKRGWSSPNNYLTYQWAPTQDVFWHAKGRRRVVVPRSSKWDYFTKEDEFQLLYVAAGGDVIGVSRAFRFQIESDDETPELQFDVLERLSSDQCVEESFSSNFIDIASIECLTLPSDSGNSSGNESDGSEWGEKLPLNMAWDDFSLTGDFSGKNWFEELEILSEESVVKQYQHVDLDPSLVTFTPVLVKSRSRTDSDGSEVKVNGKKRFSIFYGEDADEEEILLPLFSEEAKPKDVPTVGPSNLQSMALVPVYSRVPFDLSCLLKDEEAIPEEIQEEIQKEEVDNQETVPLLTNVYKTREKSTKTIEEVDLEKCLPNLYAADNKHTSLCEPEDCLPNLFAPKENKEISLYDVKEDRSVAIRNTDRFKTIKKERVEMAMRLIKALIGSIPAASLPRPLTCAPDCLACVVSRFMLGHYQERLLAADQRTQRLEKQKDNLQKSLKEKESETETAQASKTSGKVSTRMDTMLKFVKTAEETISLLDQALAISLSEKYRPAGKRTASEKSQQTDAKVNKDASTDYVASKPAVQLNFEEEQRSGWKIINSRKIRRLKKSLAAKSACLNRAQETIDSQKGQIILLQDLLKELRRNVREERRHVKTARQEVLQLRRKLKAKPVQYSVSPWQQEPINKNVGVATQSKPINNDKGVASQIQPINKDMSTQITPINSNIGIASEIKPINKDIGRATETKPIKNYGATETKPINKGVATEIKPISKGVSTQIKPIGYEVATLSAQAERVAEQVANSVLQSKIPVFKGKSQLVNGQIVPAKPPRNESILEQPVPMARSKPASSPYARPPVSQKSASWMPPFYTDKKAFREDMNQQIKSGKCRLCGMSFSSRVDRRLIEEHIIYHVQFNH